jgi:hypothetical protein
MAENEMSTPINKSLAERPDLDWSQITETVRMLNLSVAQIDMAMRQSDDSISALTNSFTSMVAYVNMIQQAAATITDEKYADALKMINDNCNKVAADMGHSIVAFQFYDKLTQRLDHVNHSLNALCELVSDGGRLYNPVEWVGLQQKIRSRYTMKEEQEMFDILLAGASVEQALDCCREKINSMSGSEDDIELF